MYSLSFSLNHSELSFSTISSIYINLYLLSSKTEGSARKTHFPDCDPSLIPAMAWQQNMFKNQPWWFYDLTTWPMTQDDPNSILMISIWYPYDILMIFKLTGPWNPWNKLCKLLGKVGQNLTSPETLRAFGPWPWPKLIGLIFANMSSLRMHGHVATSEYMMTIDDKFRDRFQKLCISMHIFACLFLSAFCLQRPLLIHDDPSVISASFWMSAMGSLPDARM